MYVWMYVGTMYNMKYCNNNNVLFYYTYLFCLNCLTGILTVQIVLYNLKCAKKISNNNYNNKICLTSTNHNSFIVTILIV